MCVCVCICMYVCMCVYVCMYMCMYICIRMYVCMYYIRYDGCFMVIHLGSSHVIYDVCKLYLLDMDSVVLVER